MFIVQNCNLMLRFILFLRVAVFFAKVIHIIAVVIGIIITTIATTCTAIELGDVNHRLGAAPIQTEFRHRLAFDVVLKCAEQITRSQTAETTIVSGIHFTLIVQTNVQVGALAEIPVVESFD
jgi:hypothetical protein